MSKQQYISRYLAIISKLRQRPVDYTSIEHHLERHFMERGLDFSYSIRTFQRDIKDIYEHFELEIKFDRRDGVYRILEEENAEHMYNSIFQAYEMADVLNYSKQFQQYIFFETRKPNGLQHFYSILQAISHSKEISVEYKKFNDDNSSQRILMPLALKESQNRWYLISLENQIIKTFALDRILDLSIGKRKFKRPLVDINSYFKDYFGVITDGSTLENIELNFKSIQAKYVETFPLHHSQEVIYKPNENAIVRLKMCITHDFIQALLMFGNDVTVISPNTLIDKIKGISTSVLDMYTKAID